MNTLDRVIGWFAPSRAVSRARARLALRLYDGANPAPRQSAGWKATGADANAEVGAALVTLRNRSRDICRNNEFAKAALRARVTALVGTGIRVDPEQQIEKRAFKAWSKSRDCDYRRQLNFGGLQRQIVRSLEESGEVLVRKMLGKDRGDVPLSLMVLEADHLDHSKTETFKDGGFVVFGVEFSAQQEIVAYWLHETHPGANIGWSRAAQSVRVPAADVLHIYDPERPGQVRGVPMFAASLMRHRSVADYEQAQLLKKKIEACFGALVTTDDESRSLGAIETDSEGKRIEQIRPGMIEYLRPGEEVTTLQPSASGDDGYMKHQMHALAAGAGVMYAQLTGDLESANYSSLRFGMINGREEIEQIQNLILVPQLIDPVMQWWRDAAMFAGKKIRSEPAYAVTMPRRPWVDPLKEVQAARESIEGHLTTYSEMLRELGWASIDEYIAERAEDERKLKQAGLSIAPAKAAAAKSADNLSAEDQSGQVQKD